MRVWSPYLVPTRHPAELIMQPMKYKQVATLVAVWPSMLIKRILVVP